MIYGEIKASYTSPKYRYNVQSATKTQNNLCNAQRLSKTINP